MLVAGPPRSGTTWLHRELCKSESAYGFLPECTLLTQQVSLYSRTRRYCDAHRFAAYFGSKAALDEFYRDTVAKMLDLVMRLKEGAESCTLILKDPELSHVLCDLGDVMPAHQLVVLIRDPRDVIASFKRVTLRKQEPWDIEASIKTAYSYYHGIHLYRKEAEANACFVRYEDLIAHGLDDLRNFLELPGPLASEDDTKVLQDVMSHLDKDDPFFSDLYLKPTTSDAIGAYRATLSRDEISQVERVFSGVLSTWRYQIA